VVPAAIAFQFTRRYGPLAIVSWLAGAAASAAGLLVSFRYDLPTGPMVVVMFGLLLLVAGAARRLAGARVSAVDAAVREPA
jgi:ABC-type Mn2+/Zn2+ transport system permease subunit